MVGSCDQREKNLFGWLSKIDDLNLKRSGCNRTNGYIGTIYDHSFQTDDSKPFHEGVIRLLNLVHIVRDEWNSNVLYVEMDARGDIEDNSMIGDFIANAQVGMLETTYCKCHQQLAELLNREVYAKRKMHLAALADAFSYNVPY